MGREEDSTSLETQSVPTSTAASAATSTAAASASGSKKRSRVAMPAVNRSSNNSAGSGPAVTCSTVLDWDGARDEARLLEEANSCARCAAFFRFKGG